MSLTAEQVAKLRKVATDAYAVTEDGTEGRYVQFNPQLIVQLLDVYSAAVELVDSWYSGEEGPAYLGLREAVYAVR